MQAAEMQPKEQILFHNDMYFWKNPYLCIYEQLQGYDISRTVGHHSARERAE